MRKPIALQDLHNARIHDGGDVARHALTIIQQLEAENERLRTEMDALAAQICEYHDTNPLNETVVELEKHRDALEAENRVVRELMEDALDVLWSRDREYYERLQARCYWQMPNESPLDAEDVLHRLKIHVEVPETTEGGKLQLMIAEIVRRATDPLLARIAALLREYQDYQTVAGHCSIVYDHFSGGRISKPFTLPSEVIAQAEAIQQEDFREWLKDELAPIKDRLQEFVQAWCEAIGGDGNQAEIGDELIAWIEETFKEMP